MKEKEINGCAKVVLLLKYLIEHNEISLKKVEHQEEVFQLLNIYHLDLQHDSKLRTVTRNMQKLMKVFNTDNEKVIQYSRIGKTYSLKTVNSALQTFVKSSDNAYLISELAKSIDVDVIKDIQDVANRDTNIFYFLNSEFEKIDDSKKTVFDNIKLSISNRTYISFTYNHITTIAFNNIMPLRILFNENNWYLLGVIEKEQIKFFRINFIDNVELMSNTFHNDTIKKFANFLPKIQNPLTLFGVNEKKAIIQASPRIALYFANNRKKFLSSQEFIQQQNDGSVLFSVKYTQPLEVLIFIKRWLPDLKIISSPNDELQIELKNNLMLSLKDYENN